MQLIRVYDSIRSFAPRNQWLRPSTTAAASGTFKGTFAAVAQSQGAFLNRCANGVETKKLPFVNLVATEQHRYH
jgi:hypothetical protein